MTEPKVYPTVERIMQITRFDDEKVARAAIRTLQWLEQGAPHDFEKNDRILQFTMDTFRRAVFDETNHYCGTACCIAGAVVQFCDADHQNKASTALQEFFQIDTLDENVDPLVNLFYPWMTYVPQQRYNNPHVAAETLRRYLFTGVVQWT